MKKKEFNPEHVGLKGFFGVTALSTNNGLAAIFMSTLFMTFMTDYAGLGAWGATLATILLLVARIVDAVDDPLQSMIMDNAKVRKYGKYKPFFLLSIMLTTIGVIALYALPKGITSLPLVVTIWVIFFYLVYDVGTSFFNVNLMIRSMTTDENERAKLVIGPRVWVMILGMIGSAFTTIAVAIKQVTGSYNTAFMLLALIITLIGAALSVLGWFIVKEKHIVEKEETEKEAKIDFRQYITLFKQNRAILVEFLRNLFFGFVWTMLFAAPSYYVKWAFCADASGAVNDTLYGTYTLIVSMMMLLPLLLGTAIANPIMNKVFKGNPKRMNQFDFIVAAVGGAIIFVGHITGLNAAVPAVFFIGMFIMATAIGVDFIPSAAISMEIMDYTIYKTGEDKSAMSGTLSNLLGKAQTAVSSALVGAVLIAIGYVVDSDTGDFIGDISKMPSMLTWMAILTGLIPAVLAVVSAFIMQKYPINADIRKEMREALKNKEVKDEGAPAEEAK